MRRLLGFCRIFTCTAVLAGCAGSDTAGSGDTAAVSDTAAGAAAAPSPGTTGTLSLAQLAGRWNARAIPETGSDTTPTTFVMTATADSTGWTMEFPNREPVPVRLVGGGGDSLIVEAGPYASVRRQGVQVRTHSVWRLEGDRLVGYTVARYTGTGPDSVLRLRTEATRAPKLLRSRRSKDGGIFAMRSARHVPRLCRLTRTHRRRRLRPVLVRAQVPVEERPRPTPRVDLLRRVDALERL